MPVFSPDRAASVCSTPKEGVAAVVERALPAKPGRVDALEVTNHRRFERRLAGLSAKFINLPAEQVDQEIEQGLSVVTEALDADRITVAQIDPHSGDFVVTHSYTSPGVPAFPHRVVRVVLPWFESAIMNGQIVTAVHPDELPPEAQHEREYMRAVGEKSTIVVPFRVAGRVTGGMSIDSFREYRRWDDAIISRVQDVADIFASALARKQVDQELENAYSEIQRLKQQLESENTCLREEISLVFDHTAVVGSSAGIRSVLKNAEQVAATNSVVLILGETGTGKELIARTIHDLSQRKSHPMVKVNCAALPTSLIESELFGRERGAYTGSLAREIGRFELAHNSTIFLDEIGELPVEVQSKLLRVLQEGQFERLGSSKTISVDVRVIAATSRNLQAMVDQGRFRQDLFYRLNVFPVEIPPLRERAEDIPALVWHLLKDLGKRMGRKIEGVHASTMQEFQKYGWPGNVRELRNVIERNLILNTGTIFRAKIQELEPGLHRSARRLDQVETDHLRTVLQSTRWRIRGKGGAAEIIGLKPTTLEAKMKKLGIRRPS
jgi:formate hydrogenlyase transcriptional activator